jgi:peptide chain release factor subunit 1
MDSETLRPLLTTRGPFASVYFEGSHDTQDAAAHRDVRWRGLREQLVEQGAARSVTADIERAVMDLRPPIGRGGRGLIAGADGVVVNKHLLRSPAATVVRVSELPYIVPIVEHGFKYPNYLLVTVDHTGADITVHTNSTLGDETVDSGGYPVHKASGAETAGCGYPQLRTDEAACKNLRAVADRVSELVDDVTADAVFVAGEVRPRSDLLAALPERIAERAVSLRVGARHSGHGFDEVQQDIHAQFLKQRLDVIGDVARRFEAEVGRRSGLAVEGLGAVCSALGQGAVETLIIGDIGGATVVADEDLRIIAPNAIVLAEQGAAAFGFPDGPNAIVVAEQGAAAAKTVRADEALPLFAVSIGASLVRTDERIAPADGVGAVLRYAPPLHGYSPVNAVADGGWWPPQNR